MNIKVFIPADVSVLLQRLKRQGITCKLPIGLVGREIARDEDTSLIELERPPEDPTMGGLFEDEFEILKHIIARAGNYDPVRGAYFLAITTSDYIPLF